jgi:hypothetical protein
MNPIGQNDFVQMLRIRTKPFDEFLHLIDMPQSGLSVFVNCTELSDQNGRLFEKVSHFTEQPAFHTDQTGVTDRSIEIL